MPLHHHSGPASRYGFTLFEVAISLVLVSIGVISVMMVYPMGIKTQLLARFQLYASAKAEEMVESFNASHNANPAIDAEGLGPWDVPVAYKTQAHDLESRVATHRFGLIPLPMDIARRLDSDADEIQQILAQGGYLYYSQPMAASNAEEQGMRLAPPNETQRMVIAVTGFAQHNAIGIFPWKAWPYLMPYPSAPMQGLMLPEFLPAGAPTFHFHGNAYCWEATSPSGGPIPGADSNIRVVFDAYKAYTYDNTPTVELATAYLQAALQYCQLKGLTADFYAPNPIPDPVPDFTPGTLDLNGEDTTHQAWKQVQAMRYLSHAATAMTRWKSLAELGGQPSSGMGLAIGSNPNGSPAINLTHDLIVYYHERCMNLIMRYAASFPYDWGAPRPLQRPQMMDFPLIEFDLFQPPLTGVLFSNGIGNGTIPAAQWKPLPARPIHNVGVSYQFPIPTLPHNTGSPGYTLPDGSTFGSPQYQAFWGDPSRSTLTKEFKAAERCRQIVFWAVDWQSYEDCETAASAPVDASKYPMPGPLKKVPWADPATFSDRMNFVDFRDEQLYSFRNPEKVLSFRREVSQEPTGLDVTGVIGYNHMGDQWDRGTGLEERKRFSGLYGADRNFNRKLDRGDVPRSVRLRATTVARFNFYDPRLPMTIR
jgi:hypothetical protein